MIGRITNQMSSSMTLAGIESALDRLDTTQQELSTGKRINQPSDDPSGTSLTLQLNTQLSNLNTYSNNVTDGTGWAQASSSAMTDVTNAVQRIRELTLEASNGTQSTADMQASAQEVNQLIDEIKQDANTQYNGQYVFSGSATSDRSVPVGLERRLRRQHRHDQPADRPRHVAHGQREPGIGARHRPDDLRSARR